MIRDSAFYRPRCVGHLPLNLVDTGFMFVNVTCINIAWKRMT